MLVHPSGVPARTAGARTRRSARHGLPVPGLRRTEGANLTPKAVDPYLTGWAGGELVSHAMSACAVASLT